MEMKAFYDKRDIKETTLVWKEGLKEWLPLGKADLFSPVLNDVPPPLPPDVFNLKPQSTTVKNISLPSLFQTPSVPTGPAEEAAPLSVGIQHGSVVKVISLFVAVIIIVAGILVYKDSRVPNLHIRGISPYNREQLENQLAIDERNMSFALALSMDRSNLWITTNQKNNLSVTIDLHANPKRILAEDNQNEILVRLQGMVVNHLGHFTTMKILKGSRFYPGEYNVHIKGKKIHWLNQYLKLNKHELNQPFEMDFKTLIYSGNSREFERKLVERHVEKINKSLKPWQDKLEAMQTLKSLTEKTLTIFGVSLANSTKGKDFVTFEQNYIKEIAAIVQVIVLAAHDEIEKGPDYKIANEAIIGIGKRLGEMASDMITKITNIKKLDLKTKNKWRQSYQVKTDSLLSFIQNNITQVENQIKELQAQTRP